MRLVDSCTCVLSEWCRVSLAVRSAIGGGGVANKRMLWARVHGSFAMSKSHTLRRSCTRPSPSHLQQAMPSSSSSNSCEARCSVVVKLAS